MSSPTPLLQFSSLCSECRALELDEKTLLNPDSDTSGVEWEVSINWELYDQWPDMPRVHQRRRQGCDNCDLLFSIVSSWALYQEMQIGGQELRITLHYVTRPGKGDSYSLDYLRFKFHPVESEQEVHVDCPIASATTRPEKSLLDFAKPPTHLDDDRLEWMRSKIDSCIEHGHTRPQLNFVPDRLIRVDQEKLRLVLTKDISASEFHPSLGTDLPTYLALTYCWGPPPYSEMQLKTTKDNLSDHVAEIPAERLPEVVKDAIRVARALCIPYLWVDALCILQDVASDWDYQCTQMDNIYGNAYITISAAASRNCTEGFVDRKDRVIVPFRSKDQSATPIPFAVYRPSYRTTSAEDLVPTTWVNRGWTFQERIASTRMLLFGKSNVHFQCPDNSSSMSKYQRPYLFNSLIYESWATEVASEFSCYELEFTLDTDVLPSIAGIATLFSKSLSDDYVAGLRRKDLYRCLHWDLHRHDIVTGYKDFLYHLRHPPQYIAPSWSWASRSHLVLFRMYRETLINYARGECAILDVSIQLKGTSPFGEVTGGHIDVLGKCYASSQRLTYFEVRDTGGVEGQTLRLDDQYLTNIEPDCVLQDLFEEAHSGTELTAPITFLLIGSTIAEEWDKEKREEIRAYQDPEHDREPDRMAYGLLIHPTEKPGEFFRVGTFSSECHDLGGLRFFKDCETETVRLV
ncbi:hypothetical protein FALBO_1102 [Fusarium albosuccineum]|uniref:Heterokaryon incompatibility domain-containing protein n=1 Tax=Fusarium albosuccineum TaxID=1237068 RepID=A0A8H4LLX5_9HYPO|nr:hypothetical protein FALBO_1102 [Fusarium albosuccineum]